MEETEEKLPAPAGEPAAAAAAAGGGAGGTGTGAGTRAEGGRSAPPCTPHIPPADSVPAASTCTCCVPGPVPPAACGTAVQDLALWVPWGMGEVELLRARSTLRALTRSRASTASGCRGSPAAASRAAASRSNHGRASLTWPWAYRQPAKLCSASIVCGCLSPCSSARRSTTCWNDFSASSCLPSTCRHAAWDRSTATAASLFSPSVACLRDKISRSTSSCSVGLPRDA
mmetsp:Transcript_34516/g.76692  ORF Transcript_34516/g.76692 Transcript_34516/m.76692 type:complete len:229 (+) Transcript_34516:87-773(+)